MELYTFRAQCLNIVDGDTADLMFDKGMHEYALHRVRLLGIDTPELSDKDAAVRAKAQEAKARLAVLLQVSPTPDMKKWPLVVKTSKSDSFGRWLADVYVGEQSISQLLLSEGLAVTLK